jgi:biotin operon repressor
MMQRLGETIAFKDRNLQLKGADIATQRGWTGVPNFILESKEISIGAKLTYAMLLKYARELDNCFPGQDRLAKDMGNGMRSVVRYIAELEEVGLVTVQRRGQGRPSLYTIHLKASFWRKNKR